MRTEEKTQEEEVEFVDARRRETRAREHELDLEEEVLLDDKHSEKATDKYQRTLSVIEAIFRNDHNALQNLSGFSNEELDALRMLEMAVTGRHGRMTHLVYAEDRKDLLEQSLLVLYPSMAHGLEPEFDDLRGRHDRLVANVVALRGEILQLEDAQEDFVDLLRVRREAAAEEANKDDDEADEADVDADADVAVHEPVYRPEDDETRR
jgi:hypothetical protein